MKKTIIIAFAVLTTGLVTSLSLTKDTASKQVITKTLTADNGTLGSADGTPPM